MTALWVLHALAASALLGVGAASAERVLGWLGLPRRGAWVVAMLGSVLLPALSLWAPHSLPHFGLIARSPGVLPATTSRGVAAPSSERFLSDVGSGGNAHELFMLFGAGWSITSAVLLGVVLWTGWRLRRIRERCVPVEMDGVRVYRSAQAGPAVVGLLRPIVMIPEWVFDAPAEERRLILRHEREHVATGDAWLLVFSTLAVVAFPWVVALWWQQHRLRAAIETDCDARVLARGACPRTYGQILIRTAGRAPGLLSPAWGEVPSHLERRIMTMTAKRPSRPVLRSLPLLAVTAGTFLAACDLAGGGSAGRDAPPPTGPERAIISSQNATVRNLPGDTYRVEVPGDPDAGSLGFSYGWSDLHMSSDQIFAEGMPRYPVVSDLQAGSSAANGGLLNGDTILSANGRDARKPNLFPDSHPGANYTVQIRRANREQAVSFELGPPRSRRSGS